MRLRVSFCPTYDESLSGLAKLIGRPAIRGHRIQYGTPYGEVALTTEGQRDDGIHSRAVSVHGVGDAEG